MSATVENLTIEQGATFRHETVARDELGDPLDLAGASALMHIRRSAAASLELELSTENGRIEFGPGGAVTLHAEAGTTRALRTGCFRYDLKITLADGTVVRALQGEVTVRPEVTHC